MGISSVKTKQREYGIDLLRIVSMFMVVILHTLGQGGVLNGAKYGSANYYAAWLLEIAAYCAVDCYALISGYVQVNENYKPSKIIQLWLQVIFYSVGITVIFFVFDRQIVNTKDIIKSFFPLLTSRYWYFTAYAGLFFFTPFLNKAIGAFDQKTMKKLIITIVVILSVLPALTTSTDLFVTNAGYSLIWLTCLYVIGAYIKKYNILPSLRKSNLLLYIACIAAVWFMKILAELLTAKDLAAKLEGNIISYTSPFILLAAIFMLLFFSRIHIMSKIGIKVISFFAPISFGVYLIQVHPQMWVQVFKDRFAFLPQSSAVILILGALAFSICVYIIFTLIDFIRNRIFLLIRVPKLSNYIGEKASACFNKLFFKND